MKNILLAVKNRLYILAAVDLIAALLFGLYCDVRRLNIRAISFAVEAPGWQDAKVQAYREYAELAQRSQAGCSGT